MVSRLDSPILHYLTEAKQILYYIHGTSNYGIVHKSMRAFMSKLLLSCQIGKYGIVQIPYQHVSHCKPFIKDIRFTM